ncbi:type II toxin-antitoxin system VapC family toxin [Novosphingobium sp.]|uniref:type II toxin-antitoxin system VapC family toxin n=1 Tax=Novosphingobium sp. TaxID=1874826 RepID=UPI00334119FE
MSGILLDTHALFWLVSGENALTETALVAIGENQQAGTLFVSPITAWELAVATQKNRIAGRPHLGEIPPAQWFRDAVALTEAKVIPIRQRISCEAAEVATATRHRDPGDCFLMATARVKRLALVTRDGFIQQIAAADPDYIAIIVC